MNIITLNRVLLNNTPLNYRRKRILTEKDFYFKTIERTFTFSKSASGKSIKDGRAYIKRIKGNSVVWNNMVDTRRYEAGFIIREGIKIQQGHKYLLQRSAANNGLYLIPVVGGSEKYEMSLRDGEYAKICTSQYTDLIEARVYSESYCGACVISDLTKMFQAGNEPTTIEDFNARVATLGVDMYAYNEGQVIHCNTESIKSVGDNAWDEEWESGRYEPSTGLPNLDEGIRSKNRIKVLPNEVYWCSAQNDLFAHFYDAEGNLITTVYGGQYNYLPIKNKQFTTPTNAATMTIYVVGTTTYNHDIMITLVHSGWKQDTDAGYQPYWQDILPLSVISKYFPDGMKSAGSAHDEIRFNKASGKWEYSKGKIKSVNLSSIIQEETGKYGEFLLTLPTNYASITSVADIPRLLCSPFITNTVANVNGNNLNDCIYGMDDWLIIRSSRYFTLSDIKAAMAGVMLYYEAAEWEWVELDEADQNFRDYYNVADFGTEQSQSSVPSAALLADVGYYFKKSEVKELTLN